MDMTIMLGLHKFSLYATIPSLYSGHYTSSANCCKKFYCNSSKITEFEIIDINNSSTAYVKMYEIITYWVLDRGRGYNYPHGAGTSSPSD